MAFTNTTRHQYRQLAITRGKRHSTLLRLNDLRVILTDVLSLLGVCTAVVLILSI